MVLWVLYPCIIWFERVRSRRIGGWVDGNPGVGFERLWSIGVTRRAMHSQTIYNIIYACMRLRRKRVGTLLYVGGLFLPYIYMHIMCFGIWFGLLYSLILYVYVYVPGFGLVYLVIRSIDESMIVRYDIHMEFSFDGTFGIGTGEVYIFIFIYEEPILGWRG